MGSVERKFEVRKLFVILNKALAVDITLRAILQGYREKGVFWFSLDGEQSLFPWKLLTLGGHSTSFIREGSSLSPTPFEEVGTFIYHTFMHIAYNIITREEIKQELSLRNRVCRNASLVNANFSANQMCPIICRWKLVKHRYCFGDNRRTKDNRKIKFMRS